MPLPFIRTETCKPETYVTKSVKMKSATLTSKIIRILIKSSLLPITLNLEKNVFKFDFWSKPTMIHLLFHCSPNILAFILYWYAGYNSGTLQNFLENSSFAEKFSSFGVCLIYIKIHLILPLANQLNSMPHVPPSDF